MPQFRDIFAELARALALLALVFLSFVQQPLALERYGVSPAVTLAVDCGAGLTGDRGDPRLHAGKSCEACRIATAIELPEPPAQVAALPRVPHLDIVRTHGRLVVPLPDRAGGGPRAPPLAALS